MGQLFSTFDPETSNEPEDIWGIPSPGIADTCQDNEASPPPSRPSAEETYKEIIAAFNYSHTSGDQWTQESFIWDANEAAALVDTTHGDQTNPPHSGVSSTRIPSEKAVNNKMVTSFDEFLDSGHSCSLNNFAWDPQEAATLRLVDIRDWHNNATHLQSDFDAKFLDRRTNLWKLVFFQESLPLNKAYLSPFINPPAHTSRRAPYVLRAPNAHLRLQQVHISHHAIPTALADTRAEDALQLLAHLNAICETTVTITPDLHAFLEARIWSKWDVGTVYGSVRAWWADFALGKLTLEVIESRIQARKDKDRRFRRNAVDHLPIPDFWDGTQARPSNRRTKRVARTHVPPRRIWDLYSNRVLPYHIIASPGGRIPSNVWAVSHCWVGAEELTNVLTSVNGRQWPVPLPTDVSLDQVRIELLNMGAEYVFLDVLCLRQLASPDAEDARRREWELDVPTLGHIYQHTRNQTVVVYFNGLGRPFDPEGSRLASPLHWLNRAWTLQETTLNWLPGGLTREGCTRWDGRTFLRRLHDAQDALGLVSFKLTREPEFVDLLRAMRERPGYADKKPYDSVAALAYLIPNHLPHVYTESTVDVEDMWCALVESLSARTRLCLLMFGAGGDASGAIPAANARRYWESRRKGRHSLWRPTWNDIMRYPEDMLRKPDNCFTDLEELRWLQPQAGSGLFAGPRWATWYYHWAYVVEHPTVIEDCIVVNYIHTAKNAFVFKTNFGLEYVPPYANGSSSQRLVLVGIGGLECWLLCVAHVHGIVYIRGRLTIAVNLKLGVFYMSDPQVRQRIEEEALGVYMSVAYCDEFWEDLW